MVKMIRVINVDATKNEIINKLVKEGEWKKGINGEYYFWQQRKGLKIVGGTTIGKEPQTVLLDLTYQGGEIRIDNDEKIEINYNDIDEAGLNEE